MQAIAPRQPDQRREKQRSDRGLLRHPDPPAQSTGDLRRHPNGRWEIDPARPNDELLADLAEAIALVRTFLSERGVPLDDVIELSGFERKRRHCGLQGGGE